MPASQDDTSLRKLIERPPITSIEIVPLTKQQLDSAFRLHVGPVSESLILNNQNSNDILIKKIFLIDSRTVSFYESNNTTKKAQT